MNIKKSWINIIYSVSTGTKKVRTLLTPIGVLIFGIFVAIYIVLAISVDRFLGFPVLKYTWCLAVALFLGVVGLFYVTWSVAHFVKVKGTPVPLNPPPKLVCSGPYKYTRNPMLTGVFSLMFGIGFFIGSISLILIFTPLFIITNLVELKMIEEPELEKRLGEDYVNYKRRTPMFIPGLRI